MSARSPATSVSSSLRTFTSSASVQCFSPGRTGSVAAPERAAAVMSGSLSANIGDDDCAGVDLESVQSQEDKSLSPASANTSAPIIHPGDRQGWEKTVLLLVGPSAIVGACEGIDGDSCR